MRGLPNYSRHFKMETKKKIVTPQQGTGNSERDGDPIA